MAETYDCLYSVGPNAVGPGTSVVASVLNPQKNRGTITRMYKDDNGINVSQLAAIASLNVADFPGTSIPLSYTTVKQLSNTLALVVETYGMPNGSGGYRRVMTRNPGGYRDIPVYPKDGLEGYASNARNYKNGKLEPSAILRTPIIEIQWSSIVYLGPNNPPDDNKGLIGYVNSNAYSIFGYSHAQDSLRFDGTSVVYEKYGGSDRFIIQHTVSYDPKYKWNIDKVTPDTTYDEKAKTFTHTRVGGYIGYPLYDSTTFPTLQ